MSFLPGAAANVAATTTTSLFSKIWDHSAGYANYLIKFADNHESLTNKMVELRNIRDHVKRRIQVDEASGMMCTPVVAGWLGRVEAIEHEVDLILQDNLSKHASEAAACKIGGRATCLARKHVRSYGRWWI